MGILLEPLISSLIIAPTASDLLQTPIAYIISASQLVTMVKVLAVLYDGGQHAKDVPELLGTTENKLAVTAGIGSDHVDLNAANTTNGGITVAEVTGSNVVSVAEHVVMTILVLIRNFVPAHEQIERGDWDVAAAAKQEYDLEGKVVGTVAVGRIGERVLRRLKAFDCKELLYFDYQPLSSEKEKEIGCRRVENLEDMLAQCDVVTINCPLHEKTKGLFNKEPLSKMKKGSWLVNTARGAIVVKEDVAEALKTGQLNGYG